MLKYGLIMNVMFMNDRLKRCVDSLLTSDYDGQIVIVEDSNHPDAVCEDFFKDNPRLTYVKNTKEWRGPDQAANLGFEKLDRDADIILYSHSDVQFRKAWFADLRQAWDEMFPTGKVGMLNVQHSECYVENPNLRYGLAYDVYVAHMGIRRLGRTSIVTSFLYSLWEELQPFDMGWCFDCEIQWLMARKHLWNLWTNNEIVLHIRDAAKDEGSMTGDMLEKAHELVRTIPYPSWRKKYGFDLEDYINAEYRDVKMRYKDIIIKYVNEKNFDAVDFVFPEIIAIVEGKKHGD